MWVVGMVAVVLLGVAASAARRRPRRDRLEAVQRWALGPSSRYPIEMYESRFGYSLRVTRDVEPGERVVEVGRSKCLSARDSNHTFGSAWSRLAARLCCDEEEEFEESPLVESLDESDAPTAWSSEEALLLSGTRALAAREALLAEWRAECPVRDFDKFRTAMTIVASRCYELNGPVLIPVLDLADHSDAGDACMIDVDKSESGEIVFSLVATRRLRRGDPVTTNYFGGARAEPLKALDAFGWVAADFVDFGPGIGVCETIHDLHAKVLASLSPDQAAHILKAKLRAIDDNAQGRRKAKDALTKQSDDHNHHHHHHHHRIALADTIVQSERRAITFFLDHLRATFDLGLDL